jgi:hypothetical protein
MNGKRAKQLRKIASTNQTKSTYDPYKRADGSIGIPGDSMKGGYITLKHWFEAEARKGNEPWKETNKIKSSTQTNHTLGQ